METQNTTTTGAMPTTVAPEKLQKETFIFSVENLGKIGTPTERYEIDLNELDFNAYFLQAAGDINPFLQLYINLQEHINNCICLMVHDIKAKNFDSTTYNLSNISSLLMQISNATKKVS